MKYIDSPVPLAWPHLTILLPPQAGHVPSAASLLPALLSGHPAGHTNRHPARRLGPPLAAGDSAGAGRLEPHSGPGGPLGGSIGG